MELDRDIHLYLTKLMVAALVWVGESLVMFEGIQIRIMTRKAFNNMFLKESSCKYDNYRLFSSRY